MVFSVDEKSSVQALDRTQPGLPIKKGRCGTMTHDYKRHGTTTLFAALDVATGVVIGESYRRHRHQEVLRFLKKVEKAVPKEQELHIILDNYATHKHDEVLRWIERGKRIFLHFVPTSSSWLNMVERFFRTLTDRQIRRGVFTSVKELEVSFAFQTLLSRTGGAARWRRLYPLLFEETRKSWRSSPAARTRPGTRAAHKG